MAFEDLGLGAREKIIELTRKLATGKYSPHFKVMGAVVGRGPCFSLYYTDDELAEQIETSEAILNSLSTQGYIELDPETRRKIVRTGSLRPKAYEQYDSHLSPCNFARIVQDSDLAQVLTSRWRESNWTFEAGAHLSTTILLGSILEGVLLAKVQQNPEDADRASAAPIDKSTGKVRPLEKWPLSSLIAVSYQCGWISKDRNDFADVLRNYRNFVHPREQVKQKVDPDSKTCDIAREIVEAVLKDLNETNQ